MESDLAINGLIYLISVIGLSCKYCVVFTLVAYRCICEADVCLEWTVQSTPLNGFYGVFENFLWPQSRRNANSNKTQTHENSNHRVI